MKLLLPSFVRKNKVDVLPAHVVAGAQLHYRELLSFPILPKTVYGFPICFRSTSLAFLNCIMAVFSLVSKLEMQRIATCWIVLFWTVVKHTFSFWNRPIKQYPHSVVRGSNSKFVTFINPSVTARVDVSSKWPATIWIAKIYLGKKAICEGWGKTLRDKKLTRSIWLHNQFVWLCRASGCFNTAEAFSL